MLRSTPFLAPYDSAPVPSRACTCLSLQLARAIHSHSSFVSLLPFRQFRHHSVRLSGGEYVAAAVKKKRHNGAELVETDDGFVDDEDFNDDFIDEFDDDEEGEFDDDDEGMLGLEKMNKWFEKRPKGFGEGKVYDTSVEDKLLEEMQQSRIAQAENSKKLKSNPVKHASNETVQKKKEAELVPIGGRVRLVNLPKKKNILRDLKSALQGIPGIINIVPAVMGNKKTRDPICKGFAIVDFKHEKDAVRFIELYTGQTITFGKIQKQIKCELVNLQSSFSSPKLSKNLSAAPQLVASAIEEDSNEDSNMDGFAHSSWDETNSSDDLNDLDDQMDGAEQEDDEENQEQEYLSLDDDERAEMRIDPEINPLPSEQVDGNPAAEQNSSAKVKQEKAHKKKPTSKEKARKVLDIPGSARRLKIKEKAVLSDVFSKYGSKATLASRDSKQTWNLKVRVLCVWSMSRISEPTKPFAVEMVLTD